MTTAEQLKKIHDIEDMAKLLLERSMQLAAEIEKTINKPPKKKKNRRLSATFIAQALAQQERRFSGMPKK
jgi:hypothetical protein